MSRRFKKGGDRPEPSTKKGGELTKAEERLKKFDKKKMYYYNCEKHEQFCMSVGLAKARKGRKLVKKQIISNRIILKTQILMHF